MVTADPCASPRALSLSEAQRRVLQSLIRRTLCPQAIALRAKVVLAAAQGKRVSEVAAESGCSRELARRWRDRFGAAVAGWGEAAGQWDLATLTDKVVAVLEDRERSGAPSKFTPEQLCQVMALACEKRPEECDRPVSHWTSRELADEAVKREIVPKISPRHVGRFLKKWTSART